jgi:hypothetical protein
VFDGDGETGALTDGLLLLRYLFGFRDETLIAGALSSSATRDSSSEIETYTAGRIVDTASIFGIDRRTNFAGVVVPTDSTEPGSISVAETFSGLTFELPVFLAAVPDEDRLIVVEQKGRVYVFENDSDVSIKNTLLDLSEVVLFEGGYDEQGLLGFAFDPRTTQLPIGQAGCSLSKRRNRFQIRKRGLFAQPRSVDPRPEPPQEIRGVQKLVRKTSRRH